MILKAFGLILKLAVLSLLSEMEAFREAATKSHPQIAGGLIETDVLFISCYGSI
ncbi:MAG: hypothetical protein AAGM67_09015 [Bacteroidota bacterium]